MADGLLLLQDRLVILGILPVKLPARKPGRAPQRRTGPSRGISSLLVRRKSLTSPISISSWPGTLLSSRFARAERPVDQIGVFQGDIEKDAPSRRLK